MKIELKGKFNEAKGREYAKYRIKNIGCLNGNVRLEENRLIVTFTDQEVSKKLKKLVEELENNLE